jgi:hypothetical protein
MDEHTTPTPPEPPAPEEQPPGGGFENAKRWAGDLFGQASDVITRPAEFFGSMPREGGFGTPTVFVLVMGVVAGLLGAVLCVTPGVRSLFTVPLGAFAAAVVGAFVVHALAMAAGGTGTLESSYRVAAYLMAFLPIAVVAGVLPYLDVAVAAYALYALIQGVAPVHRIEERKAWTVFGAAGAVLLLLMLLGQVTGRSVASRLQEAREDLRQSRTDRRRERLERRQERLEKRLDRLQPGETK